MLGIYLNTVAVLAPSRAGKLGFALFCRPFRQRMTEKQHNYFNSAAEKFTINHEGYQVQAYRWGNGSKKVLFLHGWQSHTYRWKTYIEALSKIDYTIYALDAPGHGLSSGKFLTVPLYGSLISNFIKEHDHLHSVIGHSLGGFSLLYALSRDPALAVGRIILLAPPGEASDFISVFKETLGLSDRTLKLVVKAFAERYQVTPDFFSARKFAESVRAKGLIIHDEDDKEAPYRYSPPLHQAWKQSRLVTTKGYGHNLKSISVVREVVDFIQEPLHHHVSL